jgi:hypothetical protein
MNKQYSLPQKFKKTKVVYIFVKHVIIINTLLVTLKYRYHFNTQDTPEIYFYIIAHIL